MAGKSDDGEGVGEEVVVELDGGDGVGEGEIKEYVTVISDGVGAPKSVVSGNDNGNPVGAVNRVMGTSFKTAMVFRPQENERLPGFDKVAH